MFGLSRNTKILFQVLLGILIIYFFFVPFLWPKPKVTLEMVQEHPYNQDLEFKVPVHTWHSNYNVQSIRFYVDPVKSTAKGSKGLFYPTIVYEGKPKQFRYFMETSRITRPQSQTLTLTLPLSKYAGEDLVQSGTLSGKIDTTIYYLPYFIRYRYYGGGYRTRTEQFSVPFDLKLTES